MEVHHTEPSPSVRLPLRKFLADRPLVVETNAAGTDRIVELVGGQG
jgi:hypothetical protein